MDDAGYERLVEHSPMPIAVHMEGILIFANQAAARLMHADSPEQLVGRSVMEFVHPDSQELVKSRIAEIYKQGKHSTDIVEEKFICEDGEVIDVEIASLLFRYEGKMAIQLIARDITERKKAQTALAESEKRFRQLADAMPQMIMTASPDGRVDYRNRQWYMGVGLPETAGAEELAALLHPDDKEKTITAWWRSMKTGKPYQAEFRLTDTRKPGTYRWFLGRAVPATDADGQITKWYGAVTDITDVRRTAERKKQLEAITAALKEQRKELVELGKAKDEFISLASHQLRTPATGVKQFIGMALEGYAGELTDELRLFLERAYESNERQIAIINDLLKVAQVDAGKVVLEPQDTDVIDLINRVIHESSSCFQERAQTVEFQSRTKQLHVVADPARLRMVFDNIIDNASKYTPHGKSIHITALRSGGGIRISVRDEGVGIDPADIDKIFKKFSRIENPLSAHVGGSGLGLYWVEKIVSLHGGSISVESEPGKGTNFTILLPLGPA